MSDSDVEYRLFVGGLAWTVDESYLEEAFSAFGKIVELEIIRDMETGRSRGFGFVTYSSKESMENAMDSMNGQPLDGFNITVNEAKVRSRGSRGGYNSREY